DRPCDLGLVALGDGSAQLRAGDGWCPVVPLRKAHTHLADLARRFLDVRGTGPEAPWHVAELPEPLIQPVARSRDVPAAAPPLPFGPVPGGVHRKVPEEGLDRAAVARLCAAAPELVVTPWRGVLIPEETRGPRYPTPCRAGRTAATRTSTADRRSTSTRSRRSGARPICPRCRPTPRSWPSG